MTTAIQTIFDELTTLFQQRLRSARERVRLADHEDMQRYYKGQVDTLTIVVRDLEAMKFERGLELDLEDEIPF